MPTEVNDRMSSVLLGLRLDAPSWEHGLPVTLLLIECHGPVLQKTLLSKEPL